MSNQGGEGKKESGGGVHTRQHALDKAGDCQLHLKDKSSKT